MDKPISVGDLVQVVRKKPCGCIDTLGEIFVVETIVPAWAPAHCGTCMETTSSKGTPIAKWPGSQNFYSELSRLRRIPPLSELEGEQREEEIHATR